MCFLHGSLPTWRLLILLIVAQSVFSRRSVSDGVVTGKSGRGQTSAAHITDEFVFELGKDGRTWERNTLCMLMIVRDEEVNLRLNLPLWRDVIDCYVIGVDDRTTDGTVSVIESIVPPDKPRHIFYYTFVGFSQARNVVLRATGEMFPDASHILIADADWRPDLETVNISDLDRVHRSFQFLIWDRSGHTTRRASWLVRHEEGLHFKYRIHEVLDSPMGSEFLPAKKLGWEVHEVESNYSWHTNLHGHSKSPERFLMDLELLKQDYEDNPRDLHTLYYLGITTFSFLETKAGKGTHEATPEMTQLVAQGMLYFQQAVDLFRGEKGNEVSVTIMAVVMVMVTVMVAAVVMVMGYIHCGTVAARRMDSLLLLMPCFFKVVGVCVVECLLWSMG
ncbi:unnamed protein product [Discosporangium mesarthrocarpum]